MKRFRDEDEDARNFNNPKNIKFNPVDFIKLTFTQRPMQEIDSYEFLHEVVDKVVFDKKGAGRAKKGTGEADSSPRSVDHFPSVGADSDQFSDEEEVATSAAKTTMVNVILRPPVFKYEKTGDYLSVGNNVKDLKISSDVNLIGLRERIVEYAKKKSLAVDFKRGQLFYGGGGPGTAKKMTILDSPHLLAALMQGQKAKSLLRLGLGARHDSDDESEEDRDPTIWDSQEYLHLREPPVKSEAPTGKQASKASIERQQASRRFATSLFTLTNSPYFRAFTRYHWGLIIDYANSHPGIVTEVTKGVFPTDWNALCPDGNWDQQHHVTKSFGCSLARGKYLSDEDAATIPPMATDALFRKAQGTAMANSSSSSAQTPVQPAVNAILSEMQQTNYLMHRSLPNLAAITPAPQDREQPVLDPELKAFGVDCSRCEIAIISTCLPLDQLAGLWDKAVNLLAMSVLWPFGIHTRALRDESRPFAVSSTKTNWLGSSVISCETRSGELSVLVMVASDKRSASES
ncbi:hypothetical protein B484DRAFT_401111 [Ochromonadaceae sp. CCMP2298]|nr:hypothetical protein B484DRAFT_401111 [Ochromonadaceae sp. CCMP2298]